MVGEILKIGDLVVLKSRALQEYSFLQDKPGIVTDILEDEYGFCYIEVDFVDERGWFQTHEIQKSDANSS